MWMVFLVVFGYGILLMLVGIVMCKVDDVYLRCGNVLDMAKARLDSDRSSNLLSHAMTTPSPYSYSSVCDKIHKRLEEAGCDSVTRDDVRKTMREYCGIVHELDPAEKLALQCQLDKS